MIRRWLLLMTIVFHGVAVTAQEQELLRYRRVLVPEDQLEELGRGYRLMPRDEFERRVRQLQSKSVSASATATRITRGTYSARLENEQWVSGRGRWSIAKDESTVPADIVLGNLTLPITDAHWNDTPSLPAKLGLNPAGQLVLRADHGGEVAFLWSLRGIKRDRGLGFDFEFTPPPAVENYCEFEVPVNWRLTTDMGLVQVISEDTDAGATRRWLWEFSGVSGGLLSVVPAESNDRPVERAFARVETQYDIRESGTDVRVDVRLDIHDESINGLEFDTPESLRIVSIVADDVPQTWSQESNPEELQQRIRVEFKEPLAGPNRLVQVRAIAPTVLNADITLPHCIFRDLYWQSGTAIVSVIPPLMLHHLDVARGRQTAVTPSERNGGERVQLRFDAPDARVELQLTETQSRIHAAIGTTLRVTTSAVSAQTVADVAASHGRRFELVADVQEGWWIDAVETIPAGMFDDYELAGTSNPQVRKLTISFREAIKVDRRVKVIVRAHRIRPPEGTSLSIEQLRLLSLKDVYESRRLIAVHVDPSIVPEISGDLAVHRFEPTDLTMNERELLDMSPGAILFADDSAAARVRMQLGSGTPGFSAQVAMNVMVDAQSVVENYRVRCRPETGQIAKLLVHSSIARTQPMTWTAESESLPEMTSRRLSQAEQRSAGIGDGEVWEIGLLSPVGSEFELRGVRSTPLADKIPIALLSIPEAESQTGTVVVESANPQVQLESAGLHAIPSHPIGRAPSRTLGAFRYQPAHGGRLDLTRESSLNTERRAWIWTMDLESRISSTDEVVQTAVCRIESLGTNSLEARLPANARFRRMAIQGRPVVITAERSGNLNIPLNPDERFVIVEIEYVTTETGQWNFKKLTPSAPEFRVPVLFRNWRIQMSPSFELVDPNAVTWLTRWGALLGLPATAHPAKTETQKPISRGDDLLSPVRENLVGIARSSGRTQLTWGDLATSLQRVDTTRPMAVWVDYHALASLGITPNLNFMNVNPETPVEAIASELRRRGVMMAHFGSDLILTTLDLDGASADQTILPLSAWLSSSPVWSSPWLESQSSCCSTDVEGTVHRIEWGTASPPIRYVVHRDSRFAMSIGALLGACGILWWLQKRSSRWGLPGFFVLAGILQFVPVPWLTVASASLFGWGLAYLFSIYSQWSTGSIARSSASVATGVALSAIFLVASNLHRTQVTAAESNLVTTEYRVLVPVDKNRKPTGDQVYLLPEFDRMLRHVGDSEVAGPGSFLLSARYQGIFLWDEVERRLDFYELTMIVDFEVLQTTEPIRIPLGSQRVHLLPGKATLDGEFVDLEWDESGKQIILPVESVGHHELQLRLRPAPRLVQDQFRMELAVPRLPRSRVELNFPSDATGIFVSSARGAVDSKPGEIVAELGPTETLVIHWPAEVRLEASDLVVEELYALHVGPNGARLDTRLKLNTATPDRAKVLTLKVDPRLRLLPLRLDQPIQGIRAVEGEPTSLLLDVKLPASPAIVDLSFEILGTSSVGRVYFPQVRVIGARIARRLAGLSVEPPLLMEAGQGSPAIENTRVFELAWGENVPAVQAAFRLPLVPSLWSFETHLPKPELSVNERLELGVARDAIRVEWTATVQANSGSVFQIAVVCPSEFQIADVTVTDQGTSSTPPWSRDTQGKLYLRPNRPFSKSFVLEVRGQLQRQQQAEQDVPQLRTEGARVDSQWMNIYRQPDVMLETLEVSGYDPQPDTPLGEYRSGWGRLMFQAESKDGADPVTRHVRLRVSPNHPYAVARSITTMERIAGSWHAQFDYWLQVRDGVTDSFRMEIPEEWNGPFELQPSLAYEIATIPGQSRRQLVIRPPAAVAGEYRLRIDSPLISSDDDPDGVPEIMPLDVDKVERYVVVPTMKRQQKLSWEIRGLQSANLPDDAPADLKDRLSIASYQVVGTKFQAIIQDVEQTLGETKASLARIAVHLRPDRTAVVSASFDIDPAGANRCRFELPTDSLLVHARVDGRSSRIRSGGAGQWEIEFASDQLAQNLQILFEVRAPLSSRVVRTWSHFLPRLVGIPVAQAQWRISGALETRNTIDSFTSSAIAQLLTLQEILVQADDVAADQSTAELFEWLTPWKSRFESMSGNVDMPLSEISNTFETWESVRSEFTSYAERHKLPESGTADAAFRPSDFIDLAAVFGGRVRESEFSSGSESHLIASWNQSETKSQWPGILVGLIAFGLALVTSRWRRWPLNRSVTNQAIST